MSESPAIPLLEAGFFYAVFSWIPEKLLTVIKRVS